MKEEIVARNVIIQYFIIDGDPVQYNVPKAMSTGKGFEVIF